MPSLLRVWERAFPDGAPVTSITPASGLGARNGAIEVTAIAATADSGLTFEPIEMDDPGLTFGNLPLAARVGDYVFTDTVHAGDERGAFSPRRHLPGSSFEDAPELESAVIVDRLEAVCEAARAAA